MLLRLPNEMENSIPGPLTVNIHGRDSPLAVLRIFDFNFVYGFTVAIGNLESIPPASSTLAEYNADVWYCIVSYVYRRANDKVLQASVVYNVATGDVAESTLRT